MPVNLVNSNKVQQQQQQQQHDTKKQCDYLLILGDLNAKNSTWLSTDKTDALGENIHVLLEILGLKQYISFPTYLHRQLPKSCLDLVISNITHLETTSAAPRSIRPCCHTGKNVSGRNKPSRPKLKNSIQPISVAMGPETCRRPEGRAKNNSTSYSSTTGRYLPSKHVLATLETYSPAASYTTLSKTSKTLQGHF